MMELTIVSPSSSNSKSGDRNGGAIKWTVTVILHRIVEPRIARRRQRPGLAAPAAAPRRQLGVDRALAHHIAELVRYSFSDGGKSH
jgi:hypothetical protein